MTENTSAESQEKVETSLIQRRQRTRAPKKPKISQIPFAIILTIFTVVIGFLLARHVHTNVALGWVFGISFGYVLQRARFCFTAGFRDPIITGSTSVTRAILVAFSIASIGWVAINVGSEIPVGGNIALRLILGAILFGIGMTIAGGCASGTLMRVGEGFTTLMIVLVFFIAGNFIAELWIQSGLPGFISDPILSGVSLANIFDSWFWGLVFQFIIILTVYIISVKWQKRKMGTDE